MSFLSQTVGRRREADQRCENRFQTSSYLLSPLGNLSLRPGQGTTYVLPHAWKCSVSNMMSTFTPIQIDPALERWQAMVRPRFVLQHCCPRYWALIIHLSILLWNPAALIHVRALPLHS